MSDQLPVYDLPADVSWDDDVDPAAWREQEAITALPESDPEGDDNEDDPTDPWVTEILGFDPDDEDWDNKATAPTGNRSNPPGDDAARAEEDEELVESSVDFISAVQKQGEYLRTYEGPPWPMPGYGSIWWNPDYGTLWYVGGDGDDEGWEHVVKAVLGPLVGGEEKVEVEAEHSPRGEEGWEQVYPAPDDEEEPAQRLRTPVQAPAGNAFLHEQAPGAPSPSFSQETPTVPAPATNAQDMLAEYREFKDFAGRVLDEED